MKNIFTVLVPFLLFCFLIQSCAESDCSLSTTSLAHFDFLDSKSHQPVELTEGAMITGIITIGDTLDIDTVFNQAKSYMSVPLSYTDRTTYVMHYNETLRDTIRIIHKNIPYVSDIECGAMMFYHVEKMEYTTNVLDSVILVNPDINNEEKKNFNIYYRAADAE